MLMITPDGVAQAPIIPPQPFPRQSTIEKVLAWQSNLADVDAMSEASSDAVTVSSSASTVKGPNEGDMANGAGLLFTRLQWGLSRN